VLPGMMHEMVDSFLKCDNDKARALQLRLNSLVKVLFSEVNPIPIKMALNMIGIDAGLPRMPLTEMSADKAAVLKKELIAFGFDIA
jgi:4-hydroxy-tetrahydrodipicolinate synthase